MLNMRATPAVAGGYLGGAVLGASLTSFVLLVGAGLLSPIPAAVRAWLTVAGLAALLVRALSSRKFWLPQNARQIPQEVFQVHPGRAAFRFAFELGTSVRTYITKEAPYAAALALLLLAPAGGRGFAAAALLAVGFGLGRALIVSTQTLRSSYIVEHPGWSLQVSNLLTLGLVGLAAARTLTTAL